MCHGVRNYGRLGLRQERRGSRATLQGLRKVLLLGLLRANHGGQRPLLLLLGLLQRRLQALDLLRGLAHALGACILPCRPLGAARRRPLLLILLLLLRSAGSITIGRPEEAYSAPLSEG